MIGITLKNFKNLVYNIKASITIFLIHALPRPKIELPNLDFHQFSYDERLMQPKKNLKRSLCVDFEENH